MPASTKEQGGLGSVLSPDRRDECRSVTKRQQEICAAPVDAPHGRGHLWNRPRVVDPTYSSLVQVEAKEARRGQTLGNATVTTDAAAHSLG